MVTVKRALLSCHDKTGLDAFAKALATLGVELVASGGTAAALQQAGLRVTTVESFAGITEQLDGRVKTLHPNIHAGILARRDDPAHVKAVGPGRLIDLVVVNLYPFEETIRRSNVSVADAIEQIDVGGVALLRAAAKNFVHVGVVSHPSQYAAVLAALERGRGALPEALSRQLSTEAFALTSRYDGAITSFLNAASSGGAGDRIEVAARRHRTMRYGENPHQQAGWYVPASGGAAGLQQARILQGKELSYNNVLDLDTVVRCLGEFSRPTCVIVKHASPCAIASDDAWSAAYRRAYEADAESAFGGIVGLNGPLDAALAAQLTGTFLEAVVAPAVSQEALAIFAKKPNLRVATLSPFPAPSEPEWRSILGGWLIQTPDQPADDRAAMTVVTTRQPTEAQWHDVLFAWTAAKHVKSNAIVIAKDHATVGIGQGQPSRVRAVRLAIQNAAAGASGAVLASDGFFPFPDNVEAAAAAGIVALIQPGGSVKDAAIIEAANRTGLAMVFTGRRHFKH